MMRTAAQATGMIDYRGGCGSPGTATGINRHYHLLLPIPGIAADGGPGAA
ncbi:MAG: hypothetical protein KF864_12130 [Phycisphaeraceae bacterium]|nr:hypothetical protein [Phycisphaeraceae bacterium]